MQRFQGSTNVSAGSGAGYGERDSIINDELRIMNDGTIIPAVERCAEERKQ